MTLVCRTQNTVAITLIAIAGLAAGFDARAAGSDGEYAAFLQRVVAETTKSGFTVRSTRELRAGTTSGKHQGWMAVDTVQGSAGEFTWTVLTEGGSERTRNKVFRELLQAEAQAWRDGSKDAAALTPANYEFVPLPKSADEPVRIQLKPRREDTRLVDGTLTVSEDGRPIQLEGRLAKSPSFWVRNVTIVKHFAQIGDIALPTSIESVADVRLVGQATFSMRYDYRELNGRNVSHLGATAATPSRAAFALASLRPRSN
jgi:hypothetical protein